MRKSRKKKPKKLTPKNHPVQWFLNEPVRVHYGFCPNEQAWRKALKELKCKPHPYPTTCGHCIWIERRETTPKHLYHNIVIVTINAEADRALEKSAIAAIITHESTHVWQNMCEATGEKKPSEELEALFIEQITYNMLNAYCKTRKNLFR